VTSQVRFGARWRVRGGAASRATTTMIDQCLASASNFAVGIVVARLSGPTGLGAFALAYAIWVLLTMIHRSLITVPMAIMGDMRGDRKDEFVQRGFAADVALGLMAACIIAAVGTALLLFGQHTFGVGLLSLAPWVLVLDLQDYWRQMGFMQADPRKSLMNDLVFNTVQVFTFGAVFVAGLHSVFAVVSAWGLAATVAALYGIRQFSLRPSLRGGLSFLRSRWPMSRWLASERTANWSASQLYLIVAGALLGPAALGGLKAAQSLVLGPATLVINAGGSFGLPEASRQLEERGWKGMARVARFVTGAGVLASSACGIVVLLAAPMLLKLLYGPGFVVYAPSARIFGVSIVVASFAVGPTLTLTTTRRVRPLFVLQLARLAFSVGAVFVLTSTYGVTGAALADLTTGVLTLGAVMALQSSVRRSVEGGYHRSGADYADGVRRRVLRNTELLLALPPTGDRKTWRPPGAPSERRW
jgi:O-antigen/teichoic acid export membrane protein